jgi:3-isopropylmalate/(R)-2-methylmalate dehydratase small subunit
MKPFNQLTSTLLPITTCDIDTDQIIPATYLKVTNKDGLGDGCFARWRYHEDGSLNPSFALNRPEYQGAKILVAGDNFGTGSSREHAPWALLGWGFRVVISSSFADIFRNNSLKNGLLPVTVDPDTLDQLFSLVHEDPDTEVTIGLSEQRLTLPDGRAISFPIDAFSKICMLEGVDQMGYLLKHEPDILAYEREKVL